MKNNRKWKKKTSGSPIGQQTSIINEFLRQSLKE
jgi:hypothetical protein